MKKIILFFAIGLLLSTQAVKAFPLNASDGIIQNALAYLNSSQQNDGGFGDDTAANYSDLTPFAVLAIKAAGQDPHNWVKNGSSPVDFIKKFSVPSLSNSSIPTYYSVAMMALISAGENPENVSGRNLTGELIARQHIDGSFNGSAWVTDQEFAILALVAAGYKNSSVVQNATDYLITKEQRPDGGFGAYCPTASSSCPDETSLGVMALIAAGYEPNSAVVTNALSRLKQFQIYNGGFDPGWGLGANVDSDAWAVQAIIATSNNFTEWAKSNFTINTSSDSYTTSVQTNLSIGVAVANYGNNFPFSHLIKLQNNDTGEFNYFKPVQDTSYAIMSLLGKPFPLNSTSYSQTESMGVSNNQTFSISINQTENWTLTLSNNAVQSNIETFNTSLYVYAPLDSAGKQNNITITATSSDKSNQSRSILVTAQTATTSTTTSSTTTTTSGGGGGAVTTTVAATTTVVATTIATTTVETTTTEPNATTQQTNQTSLITGLASLSVPQTTILGVAVFFITFLVMWKFVLPRISAKYHFKQKRI